MPTPNKPRPRKGMGRGDVQKGTPREPTPLEEQRQNNHTREERQIQELMAARRRTVAQGLLAGMSQAEMARHIGVSKTVITRDVQFIRAQWREEQNATYQEYVDQEVMRLERLTLAHWQRALGDPENHVPASKDAAEVVLKCIDRKVKLLGLDAPERHIVTVGQDHLAEDISSRLAALAEQFPSVAEGDTEDDEDETAS